MQGTLSQDVRYAIRTLRASPAFTLVAVAMLALGIGANTAIFSVVSAVLLRPLPFPDPDRLVLLWEDFTAVSGPPRTEAAPYDYVAWKERSHSFTDVAAFVGISYNLTGVGEPDKVSGVRTTGNLFSILGMQPLIGRTLTPGDDAPGAAPVVVLDERLWRSHFGADPTVVGRTIHLNGLARTVVGVVPADFRFPDKKVSLWVPAQFTQAELSQRTSYFMDVVARLKPGVSLAQAQVEVSGIARVLFQDAPAGSGRPGVTVAALHEHLTRDARPAMAILVVAVALVLLIAGANLANLLLARGAARTRELCVRQAIGATRGRVIRQILTENAVLAATGATLGVALAIPALRYLARLVPPGLPDATAPTLDLRVLLFTAGVVAVVVLGFGTGPAFAAADVHLDGALRRGGGRGTTARTRRLRSGLVVAELTLTVLLLIGAGLLLRSYARVIAVDPGFTPHNVLVAETALSPSQYGRSVPRIGFYANVLARVKALPGVSSAGFVNFPPFVFKGGRMFISAEGEAAPRPSEFSKFIAIDRTVTPGYFGTLRIALVRGRDFDDRDVESATRVAIVNQKMANLHWPGRDPIGRKIKLGPAGGPGALLTVVGVVRDVHQTGLDSPVEAEVYFSANQAPDDAPFLWPQYLVVRTTTDPLTIAPTVRKAVWSVDADQAVSNLQSMEDVFEEDLLNRDTQLTLVGAFAVLAFVMAAIGLYGVLAYSVAQRVPEIGVRMALGAPRAVVVIEVIRGAMILATTGIVLGLGSAFAGTRVLRSWLFDVSPADAATFAGTAILLLVMALVASAIPARRGASVNPTTVLRSE